MTEAGIDGAADVFGPKGFVDLYGAGDGEGDPDDSFFMPRPDKISLKLYPSCYASHRLIALALEARRDLNPAVVRDDDLRISVTAPTGSLRSLPYRIPQTISQAKFSGPFCMAAALLDGDVRIASFSNESLERTSLLNLMRKIEIGENPDDRSDGVLTAGTVRLEVARRGKTLFQRERRHIPGSSEDPASREAIRRKNAECLSIFEKANGRPFPGLRRIRGIPGVEEWLSASG
jgi:2-methylcitrate dehydratase PrpD